MKKNTARILGAVLLLMLSFGGCRSDAEAGAFLAGLIEKDWAHGAAQSLMGNRDTYFDRYDVYFDEGISIKYREMYENDIQDADNGFKGYQISLTGKIENILFDRNFKEDIISGVSIENTRQEIVEKLGTPDYENADSDVFGYRTDSMYIFFIGESEISEVSVYPVIKENDREALIKRAIDKCANSEYSQALALEFAELFAESWQSSNYNYALREQAEHTSRAGKTGLAFYSRGVRVQYGEDSTAALLQIYGNGKEMSAQNNITDKNGRPLIEFKPESDLVLEQELLRLEQKKTAEKNAESSGVVSPNGNALLISNGDHASPSTAGINVIYKDGTKPNFTVLTSPEEYSALWLNDRYFVYDFCDMQLAVYDTELHRSKLLSRHMFLKAVSDETIIADAWDDDSPEEIRFSVDSDGNMVFSCDHADFTESEWK